MRRTIDPFLDQFAAYDRWARRLGLADSAFDSEAALREAAFAPLRERGLVAAAWLERRGPDPRRLTYPERAPSLPDGGWIRVRTEPLGELEARRADLRLGGEARSVVLVRRTRPAPGGARLRVTVAFTPP